MRSRHCMDHLIRKIPFLACLNDAEIAEFNRLVIKNNLCYKETLAYSTHSPDILILDRSTKEGKDNENKKPRNIKVFCYVDGPAPDAYFLWECIKCP
jgi:hypothetical protein